MRKTLKLLALSGVAYLIAWSTMSAQTGLDSLPEGLPTDDIVYLKDNRYSSKLFGSFELDTSIKNRVIHDVLGPMVWGWDESSEVITLSTEWYGDLTTQLPTVADAKKTMEPWPYVKSSITGAVYFLNVSADISDPLATPFYNHRQVDGSDIGWQRSIGIDLHSAENYYKAAETMVSQMQLSRANMESLQNQFAELSVTLEGGQDPIDEKFAQIEAQFIAIHDLYTKFVFYYHRCSLAPVWAARLGIPQSAIDLGKAYVQQLPGLEATAVAVYGNGQEIVYVNSVNLKAGKTAQYNQLVADEAARVAAAQAASANSNSGGTNSGNTGGGTTTSPATPPATPPATGGGSTTPITVDGDAISWSNVDQVGVTANQGIEGFNVSAQLSNVNPHIGNYYGPTGWYLGLSITGTQNWQSYDPYGTGGLITGNIWIFVPQGNGRYWAAVFEGYGNFASNFPAGNLNFEHHNILGGTPMAYPWTPTSGVQYGWMVSTNLIYPGRNGDQRSNIIIQAWP